MNQVVTELDFIGLLHVYTVILGREELTVLDHDVVDPHAVPPIHQAQRPLSSVVLERVDVDVMRLVLHRHVRVGVVMLCSQLHIANGDLRRLIDGKQIFRASIEQHRSVASTERA
jgi:hypothetical protein